MRKVIAEFQKMPKREMLDCRITTFREILRYHGIELDSAAIFLLAGGAGFQFGRIGLPAFQGMEFWFAGGSIPRLEDEFMNRVSLPRTKHVIPDDADGWRIIKNFTDQNRPLLVMFDSRYILDGPSPQTNRLINIYNPSMTVFAGYDTDKEEAHIVLYQNDDQTEILVTSLPEFLGSRNTPTIPYSSGGVCYELNIDSAYREWFSAEYPALIERSLRDICHRMLGDGTIDDLHMEVEVIHCVQGIAGMRSFIRELEQYAFEIEHSGSFNSKQFVIMFLIFRANLGQGSYTCNRDELGRSLQSIAPLFSGSGLNLLGEQFINIGGLWRSVMRQLYNVKSCVHEPVKFLNEMIHTFSELADKEQVLFTQLEHELHLS